LLFGRVIFQRLTPPVLDVTACDAENPQLPPWIRCGTEIASETATSEIENLRAATFKKVLISVMP
jgi:hypothetical protein